VPAPYFLDASAVTKRYVAERGSAWVTALTDPASGNACWLAAISRVEVLAALYLRVRTGTLTPSQAGQAEQVFRGELATHFRLLPVHDVLLNEAMRLVASHPLRAYDAVQLAAALDLQAQRQAFGGLSPPIFLSADQRLNRAAAAEGLAVDDPNNHP
jgi:uncharacterized protein